MDYLDIQISIDGADADVNDAVRGEGSFAAARTAMDHLRDAGFGAFKISIVVTRHNVEPARRVQGDRGRATAPSCASPACARPAEAPTAGTSCIRPRTSSASSTTGSGAAGRADRRLVLPPVRARRAAAGAEPVRRRPGRVPDRPGRRRLRLPVRHPRRVPGRQPPRRRRVHRGVARVRPVHLAAGARQRRAPAPAAAATTPARAAAWPRSSSWAWS